MKKLLSIIAILAAPLISQNLKAVTTLHTIGDSTVAVWPSNYYPKTGWGQDLQFFFDPAKVVVDDKAVSGSSSKSFYENNWAAVKATIKVGDFVTIQFGINDAKPDVARHTDASDKGSFEGYLTKFCNETKARGGYPILVATVNRNSWRNGTIYPAYHNYPIATRRLAARLNLPLIDLDKMEGELRTALGEPYSLHYLSMISAAGDWPNYPKGSTDDVHFQESGAIELDNLVVKGIKALKTDPHVSKLIPALLPTYPVEIRVTNPKLGLATRSQNVPAGITFTLLAIPDSGHRFLGWSGAVTSNKAITQFKMGASGKIINAHFE